MARRNRVQIVIELDSDRAQDGVRKIQSALDGMGATTRRVTSEGTRGFQRFEGDLFRAVLGANLLERAIVRIGGAMKATVVGSTLLAARADVLDTVMKQVAKNTGNSAAVFQSADKAIQALGVDAIRSKEAILKFAAAELSVADAVKIANVARNRAQISGETTSETMERLTRSILAQEVELLKLAGIVVRQEDAFKRYGATIGKAAKDLGELERRQSFINEILRQTRNDVGLYEEAWGKAGKRLLSIPRLARQAGIALGREFQAELALGVDTTIKFLKVVEDHSAALVTATTAVAGLTFAYVALRIAMSETILVNVGAFLTGLLPKFAAVSGAMETMTLLLMGAGGTAGLIGAYGLLLAAGVALGVVLVKISNFFRNQSELAKVAQFDIEGWRKKLADAEIEVRSNEDALLLLNRVSAINNKLREEGLEPLRLNKDLLGQLREAEDRLRFSTDAGTDAVKDRTKELESFKKQLKEIAFQASLAGLSPIDRIQAISNRQIEEIEASLRNLPGAAAEAAEAIAQLRLKAQIDINVINVKQRDEAARTLLAAVDRSIEGVERIERARDEELAKFREISKKFPELRALASEAEVATVEAAMKKISEVRRRKFEEAEGFVRQLERQAGILDAFDQIEFDRLETIREIDDKITLSQAQVERARVAVNEEASGRIRMENERIFNEQQRLQERNLREYDRFLDRMVRFTDQSGNLIKNVWRAISDEFQRSVTKMVLSWIFGMRQIGGAVSGGARAGAGGIGILGGLLGGVFGGAAPVGARTPPFIQNAFPGTAGVGGLGGSVAGGIPGAVASGSGGGGILGGLTGLGGFGGAQASLLGLLLGVSVGSGGRPIGGLLAGIGGTLGGVALSGALAGVAGGVGAFSGAGVALAGFLTNPIGLAILGGIGAASFLTGVLARGKKKRQATDVANRGFDEIGQVAKAFELRQLDFLRANDQMQQVWDQMVEAWQRIGGKVGRRSITTQRPFFDQALARIEEIQRERNRRGDLIAGLPIPEFHSGGLVPGTGQRPILAAVHPGEFVLNRDAVSRIGTPRLDSANKGSGGGGITVVIHTPDKHGVEEMIRGNAAAFERMVVRTVHENVRDGGPLGALA